MLPLVTRYLDTDLITSPDGCLPKSTSLSFPTIRLSLPSIMRLLARAEAAARLRICFDGIIASESGCGALRSGEDVEFVTSERFYPWCVDLGSVMLTTKAVEKANIRFVIDKLRNDRTGDSLKGIVIPIADPKEFAILQMTIETPRVFTASADGNFFYTLASNPDISSKVSRRVLLLHL
jgi:hypothetical protein